MVQGTKVLAATPDELSSVLGDPRDERISATLTL